MKTHSRPRGFSLIEILVIVALLGALAMAVMPAAGKAIRRARAIAATSDMNRVLAQARLQAIKRGAQVIVKVDRNAATGRIRLRAWEDRNPDFAEGTFTPPGGGAPVNEVLLQEFEAQATYRLWKQGGTIDDLTSAVMFNGYVGDNSKTGLLVFLPTGALLAPEASGCGTPSRTGGRGIYIADEKGKNFFRLTVPSTLVAKVRLEKFTSQNIATPGYVPDGWVWN